jgi:integrase
VHHNVATLIDPPRREQRELRPMSAEEARGLLVSVRGDRLEALYRLAIASGLRQGELLALRWQDVDLDAGTITVRHTLTQGTRRLAEPKTDRARRTIAIDEDTVAALIAHRDRQRIVRLGGGFVFATADGNPLDHRNLVRSYHAALARAGIPRQPFHHLRHACATLLLESGEDLANVSKLLGHSSLATTADFYAHLTPRIARQAADRMRGILAG